MHKKCRKVTAAFLSCILAVLCVTAELSHHHNSTDANLQSQNAQSRNGAAQAQPAHGLVCAACVFALAHVAPVISAQQFFPATAVVTLAAEAFVCHSVPSAFIFGLRAPPALPA